MKTYTQPELTVIIFESEDVLTASGITQGDATNLPKLDFGEFTF